MSSLYIDVKAYAGSDIPAEAIPDMARLAMRLGICVWADLNGVRTLARPGDDPVRIAEAWHEALANKRSHASAQPFADTTLERGTST